MIWLLGFICGMAVTYLLIFVFLKEDGGKVIVDKWWLDNDDRWLGLREAILKEQD